MSFLFTNSLLSAVVRLSLILVYLPSELLICVVSLLVILDSSYLEVLSRASDLNPGFTIRPIFFFTFFVGNDTMEET